MSSYESEIDQKFDNGESVIEYFDVSHAVVQHPPVPTKKININLPQWLVNALDTKANSLAVSRNAIINMWLSERVESEKETLFVQ